MHGIWVQVSYLVICTVYLSYKLHIDLTATNHLTLPPNTYVEFKLFGGSTKARGQYAKTDLGSVTSSLIFKYAAELKKQKNRFVLPLTTAAFKHVRSGMH